MFKLVLMVGMLFHHPHFKPIPVFTPEEFLLMQDALTPKIDCNTYVLPVENPLRATCTQKI
jgi:hypothetical protein